MAKNIIILVSLILIIASDATFGEDKIEMKITRIKGNKELPKILYVVPWKDIKHAKHDERKIQLHSLFGDLFDPVLPSQPSHK